MELDKAIENRRSIRHFNKLEVDKNTIEKILQAGILAPSAKNKQPWHFIVIHENKDLKNKIANTLLEKTDVAASLTCEVIKDCSTLVLVFADIDEEIWDIQSVGACIENIVLKAKDLNVGSLWIGYITKIESELQKIFNINKKLIAAVALGYTDTSPSARPRKKLKEVSTWY